MKIKLCRLTAVVISLCFVCEGQDLTTATAPLTGSSLNVLAQSPYYVSGRDLHSRVWSRVTWLASASGARLTATNSYTEIATGLAHHVGGALVDSSAEIVVTPTGAQATNALHQLYMMGNINSSYPNAIQAVLPDGQHIASKPLGLAYFDYSSKQSVWIGEITDSNGQLLPSKTQGIYPDAFDGGIVADVLFENAPAGYEQSIIIRSHVVQN